MLFYGMILEAQYYLIIKIFHKIYKLTGSITQFGCTIPILKWMSVYDKLNYKKLNSYLIVKIG